MKTKQFVKDMKCPQCNSEFVGATDVTMGASVPKPGQLAICPVCAEFLAWTEELTLRLATVDDMMRLNPLEHEILNKVQEAIKLAR